ncbi:MAG: hypothetical protein U0168_11315 [Nannocystaceae bacterium]
MQLHSQNRVLPRGPIRAVDTVFAAGMDHHHFMVRPAWSTRSCKGRAQPCNLELGNACPGDARAGRAAGGTAARRRRCWSSAPVGPDSRRCAGCDQAGVAAVCVERLDRDGARALRRRRGRYGTAVFGLHPRRRPRRDRGARVDDGEGRGLCVAAAPRLRDRHDVIVPLPATLTCQGAGGARPRGGLLRRTGDARGAGRRRRRG